MSTHAVDYGSDIEDEMLRPGERVLARDSRICEVCRKPFHPTRSWQRHHNDRCRKEGWLARQHALDFEPPVELLPPVVDQRVPAEDVRALQGHNALVLERLRRGPATGRELDALLGGGSAWRTRVSDVRRSLVGETVLARRVGPRLWVYEIVAGGRA